MSVHPSVTSSTHFRPIKPQGQSVVAQVKSRRKQKRENWNIKVRKHKINAAKRDLLPADCRMQGLSKGILTMVEVSKRSISSSNSSAGQIHEDDSGGVSNHEAKSNSSGGGGGKYSSRAVTNRLVEDAKLLNEIDVSSTMELHRTNLMKMQTQELLSECQITDLSSRKWTSDAQQYLQTLTTLIRTKIEIGPSGSGSTPSSSASSNTNTNKKSKGKHKKKSNGQKLVIAGSCRHRADKVVHIDSGSSRSSSDDTSTLHLSVEPIGCTHSNIGWMKKSGNAQVPPTFSLMLMLPQTMFGSKDYLHYRYFDKRNYVMDEVVKFLAEHHSDELGTIEYIWPKGMSRSPVLQLVPSSSKFQVHLHFGIKSLKWIPPIRLVPNRSNLRHEDNNTGAENSSHNDDSDIVHQRSKNQTYNHTLMYDARHEFEDRHLSALVDNHNTLATLALIQIWGLQRGLWRNHDGWSQENVAIFLLYLIRTNRMNARMTPIQQLTVAMQFWATTNWLGDNGLDNQSKEDGVRASQSESSHFDRINQKKARRAVLVLPLESMKEKDTVRESELGNLYERQTKEAPLTDSDPPTLFEAYSRTSHYCLGPVMLDPTMKYNYLGDVSPNYMKLLQIHAKKSLEALKAPRSAFRSLFMDSLRFWAQWDMYVKISVPDSAQDDFESSTRNLIKKLEMALGNRIHGMRLLSTGNGNVKSKKGSADDIPTESITNNSTSIRPSNESPTGTREIILGIAVDPEACRRVVDRGPPSDQSKAVKAFLQLWGKQKAQLRRFKDGAIVQAVVWNDDDKEVRYQNFERTLGGFVEKIVRHIVALHYTADLVHFSLPNLSSVVDGITTNDEKAKSPNFDPLAAHQQVMKAFESLVENLRRHSQIPASENRSGVPSLGLPLAIDAVEPLSPCLRYSELFPPASHPFLGGSASNSKRISGVLMSDPILIQLRFGASSKWPSDLKAIGAAKAAMLVQLANGIDSMNDRNFDGPILVTPSYLDIGYRGYCFRILIRADPEIKILQSLVQPSPEATGLLKDLTRAHIISSKHHSMIHAVHTMHPSAPFVVRIAKRWCASHLLSDLLSVQVIELIVARVYSEETTQPGTPSTLLAGFLAFLHILSTHDWASEPFVVNPRGHISDDDIDLIDEQFEKTRGGSKQLGPPMYIIAPYDKIETDEEVTNQAVLRNAVDSQRNVMWSPSTVSPEQVVLNRVVALARRSHQFLLDKLSSFGGNSRSDWCALFQESPQSFHSFDVLFRINPDLVVDHGSSSTTKDLNPKQTNDPNEKDKCQDIKSFYTKSMIVRSEGPKDLRKKAYRNLVTTTAKGGRDVPEDMLLPIWNPVRSVLEALRSNFGQYALFFYNDLAPEVIGLVWRPHTFDTLAFSAMTAEFARPVQDPEDWAKDTLVCRSMTDILREMSPYFQDVITNVKIVHDQSKPPPHKKLRQDQI